MRSLELSSVVLVTAGHCKGLVAHIITVTVRSHIGGGLCREPYQPPCKKDLH